MDRMVQLPLFADDLNIRQEVRNTERNKKRVQFWFKFLASAAVLAPLLTLWFLFAFTQKQQIAQQQTHLNDITQHIANNLANSLTQEGANTLAGALQSPQVLPLLMQAENDLPEIANFVLVLADNNVLYSLADTNWLAPTSAPASWLPPACQKPPSRNIAPLSWQALIKSYSHY
jgi:hypothetical protein